MWLVSSSKPFNSWIKKSISLVLKPPYHFTIAVANSIMAWCSNYEQLKLDIWCCDPAILIVLVRKYLSQFYACNLVWTSNGFVLHRNIKSYFHEGKIAATFTSRIQFSISKILKGIIVKDLPL